MPQTSNSLIPLLTFVANGGAGVLASFAFAWLRTWLPLPPTRPNRQVTRLFYTALYAPRYARWVALLLAALLSLLATVLLALATGGDVLHALDTALATAITANQLFHGFKLSTEVHPHA